MNLVAEKKKREREREREREEMMKLWTGLLSVSSKKGGSVPLD